MTTLKTLDRQPSKLDYASPTQFRFSLIKSPKVEFFCTQVNIPGITLGETELPTPLKNIPIPGDKLTFEKLSIQFLVDENLENYREMHGWLTGLGCPHNYSEFRNLVSAGSDRFPQSTERGFSTEPGKAKPATPEGSIYSDGTILILSSKNQPVLEVRFSNLYPTSLSGLQYNQQSTDVDYLTADVSFSYLKYEFASVNSATTSITNS